METEYAWHISSYIGLAAGVALIAYALYQMVRPGLRVDPAAALVHANQRAESVCDDRC